MKHTLNITENFYPIRKNVFVERSVLSLAALLLIAGSILFVENPFRLSPLRNVEEIGKIKIYENEISRKIIGSLNWIQVSAGDVLYNGDEILTDKESSVTVVFRDNSELIIGPQSLIRLDLNDDEFQIELVKGKLEFKKAPASKIKLVEKGTGRVIPITNGKPITSPLFGKEIPAMIDLPVQVAKTEVPVKAKLKAPTITSQQMLSFIGDEENQSYRILLNKHPEAKKYFLEIYSDPEFTKSVLKVTTLVPEYIWISNRTGKYYYRVKIQDSEGRMSSYSPKGQLLFPISPLEDL